MIDHDGNSLADQVTPGLHEEHPIRAFFAVEGGVVDEQGVLVNVDGRVWRGGMRKLDEGELLPWMLGVP